MIDESVNLQNSFSLPNTTSNPIKKSEPTSNDLWEIPCEGLEVFTSKGVISNEKVECFLETKLSLIIIE
jgi:hypothetical protein